MLHRPRKVFHNFLIRKKSGVFALTLFTLLFSFSFLISYLSIYYVHQVERLNRVTPPKQVRKLPPLTLEAKSFVVYDANTGKILLSKDENSVRPLASLTKIQTAYLFAKRNDLEKPIVIPDLGPNHSYDFSLKNGDTWETKDLIKFMLTISSNDAAEILASREPFGRKEFISLMNTEDASSSLHFTTPDGLDKGDEIGGLGSALDMSKLLRKFYLEFPALFEATSKTRLTVTINGQKYTGIPNTNQEVEFYRGVIGSKTGFTDKAGGNLAVIYDESLGNPLILVLLGSSREGRFEDMRKLISYINENRNTLYLMEE
jgi:D-alanyl-D-alanine carboxypeptidase (penicillin-binding protein 5/6)